MSVRLRAATFGAIGDRRGITGVDTRGLILGLLFLVNPFDLEREISPLLGFFGNGSWLDMRSVAFLVCGATGFLATAAAIQ